MSCARVGGVHASAMKPKAATAVPRRRQTRIDPPKSSQTLPIEGRAVKGAHHLKISVTDEQVVARGSRRGGRASRGGSGSSGRTTEPRPVNTASAIVSYVGTN